MFTLHLAVTTQSHEWLKFMGLMDLGPSLIFLFYDLLLILLLLSEFYSFHLHVDFSYVLGAVETFLKAVPAAGIFRGNDKAYASFNKQEVLVIMHRYYSICFIDHSLDN